MNKLQWVGWMFTFFDYSGAGVSSLATKTPMEVTASSKMLDPGFKSGVVSRKLSRYIPVEVERIVYHRDQGKCQYVDPVTGRKCGSTRAIQFDHAVIPYAIGGPATVENLQIKCSMHNRISAIAVYGQMMSPYIKLD